MANEKRRGRPLGEGKLDSPYLIEVADLMVTDSSLKPTTAMKRVLRSRTDWGASDETILRRWQGKWQVNGPAFLAAARDRVEAQRRITARPAPSSLSYAQVLEMARTSPAVKWMQDAQRFAESSQFLKVAKQMQENIRLIQAVKRMQSDPMLKFIKEMQSGLRVKLAEPVQQSLQLGNFQSITKPLF